VTLSARAPWAADEPGRALLTVAALASFAIAALHIYITFVGAPAYRYFVFPPRFAELAAEGSPRPTLVTLGITAFFVAYGLYALAGAGWTRPLPRVRRALAIISIIYVVRGLAVVPQLIIVIARGPVIPIRHIPFSLISLSIGILYALGTAQAWRVLPSR
jgi:hypothetical protein